MANVRISFNNIDGVSPDNMRKGKIKIGYEHVGINVIIDIDIDGKFTIK